MSRFTDAIDVLRGRARIDKAVTQVASVTSAPSMASMIRENPEPADVPSTWNLAMLPPGAPIAPTVYGISTRDRELAEREPRTFQYYPAFNSNLTPRIYLGLLPFSQLKWYGENIPEAALFRRLRIAALTDFVPQIVGPDGEVVQKARVVYERDKRGRPLRQPDGSLRKAFAGDNEIERFPELGWMTTCPNPSVARPMKIIRKYIYTESDGSPDPLHWLTKESTTEPLSGVSSEAVADIRWTVGRPDRYNAFSSWLSRFMVNYIHYNAPTLYKIRDENGAIAGLRVIDGSTIFAMIDVRGETPAPPAPAFSQIIWGTPKQWFNTYQLWYRPMPQRPDSPYGYTSAEDGKYYLDFLYEYWQWWMSQYNSRMMPVAFFKTAAGTDIAKAFEYMHMLYAEMKGNYTQQQNGYPLPPGWEIAETKKIESAKGEEYLTVVKQLALEYGVHPSEIGIVAGATGLTGSKGQAEKGEEAHARIGVIPDAHFVEMPFNDVLLEMAERDPKYRGLTFQLAAPDTGIDPHYEDEKWNKVWVSDGMRLNEYRDKNGQEDEADPKGQMYYSELSGKNKVPVAGDGIQPGNEGDAAQAAIPGAVDATRRDDAANEAPEDGGDAEREPLILASNVHVPDHGAFEKSWNVAPLLKHCGVCPEDDDYFGAPISRETEAMFPKQGANDTEIVALSPPNLEPRPALWKPEGGEDEALADAIGGPQYLREEAAYILDRVMKLYLVPVAFVGEVDGERGAAIHYVRGNEPRQDVSQYAPEWVEKAAVLDFVIGQVDRRSHNWLTHPQDDTRPILFDNGLSFPVESLSIGSAFVEAMRGRELSAGMIACLNRCLGNAEWRDIQQLVGDDAAANAKERAKTLIDTGVMPE